MRNSSGLDLTPKSRWALGGAKQVEAGNSPCQYGQLARGRLGNVLGQARALGLLALVRIEVALAQPDRFRCDLDQLVILDISQRALKDHAQGRREAHGGVE